MECNLKIDIFKRNGQKLVYISDGTPYSCCYSFKDKKELTWLLQTYMKNLVSCEYVEENLEEKEYEAVDF